MSFYDKVMLGCVVMSFVLSIMWSGNRGAIWLGWLSFAFFGFATYQAFASPPPLPVWVPLPDSTLSVLFGGVSVVLFAIVSGCHLYIRSSQS